MPATVRFTGYLRESVIDHAGTPWWVLYLDSKFLTWLQIPVDAVMRHDWLGDLTGEYGDRDSICVKTEATVVEGSKEKGRNATLRATARQARLPPSLAAVSR